MARNTIIKQSEIIKIVPIELEKNTHIKVIIKHEIIAPIKIDIKLFQISRLLNPAIKLPVQTPVNGRGIATKPQSVRYFFKLEVLLFICFTLTENFFELTRKPLVLDFKNLVKYIIARLGNIDPINANMQACQAGSALFPQNAGFIAKGIAIFASNAGIIASIIQASQIQS